MKILYAIFTICLFVFMVGCTSNVSAIKVNQSTLIIAHRGASDRAPEETMSAFKLAVQDKADYLEMDLRQTKDGKLVLMHDLSLNRTTNGKGEVSEYSLMQIKKLDAGRWFSSKFKNQRVLSLEELINQYGSKTNYFIETRRVNNKLTMEKPLITLLNKKGLIKNKKVIVESYSMMSLQKIHKINKSVPLVQLTLFKRKEEFTDKKIKEWQKYAIGIGLDSSLVDKKLIEKLHQNNLKVYVFFFDSKKENFEQKRVIKTGADGILSNHIKDTKSILKTSN